MKKNISGMKFLKIISVASISIILFQANGQTVPKSNSSKVISTISGAVDVMGHSYAYHDSIIVIRVLSELNIKPYSLQADTSNISIAISNNPTILAMNKDIEWMQKIAVIIVVIATAIFGLLLTISIKQSKTETSIKYIKEMLDDLKRNIERSGQLRQ